MCKLNAHYAKEIMHTNVCHDPQSSSLDIMPFRGIGLIELDSNLAKWIKFHRLSSVVAMVHALTLPSNIAQVQTHFLLMIRLTYHLDDLSLAAFQVDDASVVEIAVAQTLWRGVVQQLDFLKDESEAKHLGTVAGIGIECPPLGVQLVPVGSLENLEGVDVLHHTYEKAYRELSKHCVASSFTQNSATIEHPCARTFSCSNISAAAWLH